MKLSKIIVNIISIIILCLVYSKLEWFHLVSIRKIPSVTISTYTFEWMCNVPLYAIGILLNSLCYSLRDIKKMKINFWSLLSGVGFFIASMRPVVILITGSLPNATIYAHIKGVFCILCGFFVMLSFTGNSSDDKNK